MWYFTWVLGLAMAVLFGILNAMWLDHKEERDETKPVASPRTSD